MSRGNEGAVADPPATAGWRPRWTRSDAYRRLDDEIGVMRLRLAFLLERIETPGPWAASMARCLEAAAASLRSDVQSGWRCLHEARAIELLGLAEYAREALRGRLEALRSEVEARLVDYRREPAQALLEEARSTLDAEASGDLRAVAELGAEASRLLHAHYDVNHYKEAALRERAYGLVVLLIVPLVAWALVAGAVPLASDGSRGGDSGPFLVSLTMDGLARPQPFVLATAAVFGIVGAALSGLRGVSAALQTRKTTKLPDLLYGKLLAYIQVGTGVAAGLLVYLLMFTNLLGLQGEVTFALFAFTCVVAGYSERFLVSRIERVAQAGSERNEPSSR